MNKFLFSSTPKNLFTEYFLNLSILVIMSPLLYPNSDRLLYSKEAVLFDIFSSKV